MKNPAEEDVCLGQVLRWLRRVCDFDFSCDSLSCHCFGFYWWCCWFGLSRGI